MKIKDPGKPTEMRAALVKNAVTADLAKTSLPASNSSVAKADKIAARQQEKLDKEAKETKQTEAKQVEAKPAAAKPAADSKDKDNKDAKQPVAAEAVPATPESVPTEEVLTETWSYQLPADE
jgi:glucans biosynthesis protein